MPDAGGLDGRRVVVTGSRGFIGRVVVRRLVESGADVVALHRPGDADVGATGVAEAVADLAEPGATDGALAGADLVIHLAARAGGVQFQGADDAQVFEANTTATRNLLDAAVRAGVRRVLIASSAVVYAADAGPMLDERAATVSPSRERVTGYAWSKLTDEARGAWIASNSPVDVVVARFTNVYGPGGSFEPARSTVVHALIAKAVAAAPDGELTVWGDGTQVRSFVHVEDAARAVLVIAGSGEPRATYNVATGDAVVIADLAELVRDVVAASIRIVFDSGAASGPPRRVPDGSALARLGFAPEIDLRSGIVSTLAWYRGAAS